jgi:hypothetical protein
VTARRKAAVPTSARRVTRRLALRAAAGVELTPARIRAVRWNGFGTPRHCELTWDPLHPREAVERLRAALGGVSAVSVAVGLGFLQVKLVHLPPVAPAERARMLSLEPERYFAERDVPLVVALADASDMAFGAPHDLIASWISAFEEWAPVARVEPAPLALARAVGRNATGVFQVEAAGGEVGVVDLRGGTLRSARRVPQPTEEPAPGDPGSSAVHAPSAEVANLTSLGALLGIDEPLTGLLVPEEMGTRLAAQRRGRLVRSVAWLAAALLFAIWGANTRRERTLRDLEARVTATVARAAPANAALQSLLALEAEGETIRRLVRERSDPFSALAALGGALPGDVVVLSAKAAGDEWQLDGTARDAAALIPQLDRDGRFDGVRFLSASSRFREGTRSYETFSLALRYRARP